MTKRNILLAMLIFGLGLFTTQSTKAWHDCPEVYNQGCLPFTGWFETWMTIHIPSYPDCEIKCRVKYKYCQDGNITRAVIKLRWWEVNSADPNCTQLYDDFWVTELADWDQVQYEQVAMEIDEVLMDDFANMLGSTGGDFWLCSGSNRLVEVATTKAGCWAPTFLLDYSPAGGFSPLSVNLPCGNDVGCCAITKEYCYDGSEMVELSSSTQFYPGSNSTCEGQISEADKQAAINEINQITGANYDDLMSLDCFITCD